jgi:hypothetical protein
MAPTRNDNRLTSGVYHALSAQKIPIQAQSPSIDARKSSPLVSKSTMEGAPSCPSGQWRDDRVVEGA